MSENFDLPYDYEIGWDEDPDVRSRINLSLDIYYVDRAVYMNEVGIKILEDFRDRALVTLSTLHQTGYLESVVMRAGQERHYDYLQNSLIDLREFIQGIKKADQLSQKEIVKINLLSEIWIKVSPYIHSSQDTNYEIFSQN